MYDIAMELNVTRSLSATIEELGHVGEEIMVELVAAIGFYRIVAMTLMPSTFLPSAVRNRWIEVFMDPKVLSLFVLSSIGNRFWTIRASRMKTAPELDRLKEITES